ncbi:MAG TPA: putative Fe-S cluster assembly protein SufT [Thermoanaerobaculia bacterium]|jgi:probable FeS assembly SUF system protein SufT|nr:putative Fe-S cluster assembly protein SufT [Thermoanaerobaculia bacterium]
MQPQEHAVVSRECRAIQIPEGLPVILSPGTRVRIMQSLGGNYTVVTERGHMLRIEEKDADVIGKAGAWAAGADLSAGPLEERVWDRLRTCFDPEIPVNIVDLGLVYSCEISQESPDAGSVVDIKMTLTAPGCGMGPVLAQDVKDKIQALPGVARADVEVVFDPQWNQAMMSEAAKLQLGLM